MCIDCSVLMTKPVLQLYEHYEEHFVPIGNYYFVPKGSVSFGGMPARQRNPDVYQLPFDIHVKKLDHVNRLLSITKHYQVLWNALTQPLEGPRKPVVKSTEMTPTKPK